MSCAAAFAWFGMFSQPNGTPQTAPCTARAKWQLENAKRERDSVELFVALLTGSKQGSLLIITKSKLY